MSGRKFRLRSVTYDGVLHWRATDVLALVTELHAVATDDEQRELVLRLLHPLQEHEEL